MLAAAVFQPPTFSFAILGCMLVILIAATRMFFTLTRQWTTDRPRQALREWARERAFKWRAAESTKLPPALAGIASLDPKIQTVLTRGPVTLIRLSTIGKPAAPAPMWNLIIQERPIAQNPAGLRPASAGTSFLDLFTMNGYPSILPPERFIVFANDSRDARQLAATSARGLLPADIGLLIHGPYITLDFSTRPFDPIEFDRLLTILSQLTETQK